MLKSILLASAASLTLMVGAHALPLVSGEVALDQSSQDDMIILAKQNRGGDGQRGGDSNDDDSGDDNSNDDNSNDDVSGSGRKKPRVPGGSGCDDPGDVAEHASCSP
jgi:hypothetical protein